MKKFLSTSLVALFLASALSGCMDVDPKRIGEANPVKVADKADSVDSIDKLLAPTTGKDLYEDQTILKMTKGKATVQHSNGVEVEVDSQYAVVPGDTIIVKAGGAATVLWFDDSISRLKEGTILTIDKADFDSKDITKTDINFHVVKGEIWNKVRGLVNPNSEFLSYSGSVVSGVRGSVYNLIVNGEEVTVESVEHSAFLAPVDPKTNTIGKEKRIVRGQLAKSIGKKKIQVASISPKRFKEGWFEGNKVEDKSAAKDLREKNLDRLARRVGALPGEPGYEEKIGQIEDRLAKVTDPSRLAELNSRFAQLKARESIVVALRDPNESNSDVAATRLEAIRSAIDTKGLSEDLRRQIQAEAQIELQGLDRAIEEVLPDSENLYEIKQFLRQQEVDLAPTQTLKDEVIQKNLERQYFDLNDTIDSGVRLTPDLSKQLEQTRLELQRLPDNYYAEYLKALDGAGMTTDEFSAAMDEAIKQAPAINEMLKNNPYLNGQQIPAIDPAMLQQVQDSLNSLPKDLYQGVDIPTADPLADPVTDVPPPEVLPTIDPAVLKEIQAVPTIDPTKLNLLNTTITR